MAQLERYGCNDHVSVYDTTTWTQQRHFPASTTDASELSWSPDGSYIALVSRAMNELLEGKVQKQVVVEIEFTGTGAATLRVLMLHPPAGPPIGGQPFELQGVDIFN